MNVENMKKWAEALRSGKYKQGRSQLADVWEDDEVKYCCLGVACKAAIADGVELEEKQKGGSILFNGAISYLPAPVQKWLGVPRDPGLVADVGAGPGKRRASTLNDDYALSFEEIADAIDKTIERDTQRGTSTAS